MEDPATPATERALTVHSWVLYALSDEDAALIYRELDAALPGYSFYPEADWGFYGYRPPEGHHTAGAWRHPATRAFVFLLDNPRMLAADGTSQFLVYAAGQTTAIVELEPRVRALKEKLQVRHQRAEGDSALTDRLDRAHKSISTPLLGALLAVLTGVINGLSLYLRRLPPPLLGGQSALSLYHALLAGVHFGAILLLGLFVAVLIAFLTKYAMLVIRRL